jgi:hypothetical protein
MKNEELRSQLEKLHNELHQSPALDQQQRELLQTLADEIQALLKRDEIQQHHYKTLSERLNDGVAKLEASHPQITLLMRQTIDSLAYLGI